MNDIKHTVLLNVPIDEVWSHLTDSEKLASWLMPNDFKAEVGAEFTFRSQPMGDWDGIVHCKVIELKQPTTLIFTWGSNVIEIPTQVSFELKDLNGKTELTLIHSGWDQQPPEVQKIRDMFDQGWGSKILRQFVEVVER